MAFVSKMRDISWFPARLEESHFSTQYAVAPKTLGADSATAAAPSNLIKTIREEGVPSGGGVSPRDEAVRLLHVAAEVEHALLIQYLYSAYSLNPKVSQATVAQTQIIEVAKQEMAHLITVQNLLMAIGAAVNLNRENFTADPSDYPFPVSLEPLSSDSLAKYVTAESPTIDQVSSVDQKDVIAIAQQADKAVSGTSNKVNRVGIIYAKLYWIFQENDAADGPWILPPDVIQCFVQNFGAGFHLADGDFVNPSVVANFSATKQEWGGDSSMHVDAGTPRSNALAAINWITSQGEGPNNAKVLETHFQTFLKLYRMFKGFPANAVLDVPTNPTTATPGSAGVSASAILEPVALLWARLLNVRYQILLLDVALGLSLDRSKDALLRNTMMATWAVDKEMVAFISTIAISLTSRQRTSAGTQKPFLAGAPFELEEIPQALCDQWKQQRDLLASSKALISQLKGLMGNGDPDASILDSLVTFDLQREPVINQKIVEICGD